jgi:hypothetical protein
MRAKKRRDSNTSDSTIPTVVMMASEEQANSTPSTMRSTRLRERASTLMRL